MVFPWTIPVERPWTTLRNKEQTGCTAHTCVSVCVCVLDISFQWGEQDFSILQCPQNTENSWQLPGDGSLSSLPIVESWHGETDGKIFNSLLQVFNLGSNTLILFNLGLELLEQWTAVCIYFLRQFNGWNKHEVKLYTSQLFLRMEMKSTDQSKYLCVIHWTGWHSSEKQT